MFPGHAADEERRHEFDRVVNNHLHGAPGDSCPPGALGDGAIAWGEWLGRYRAALAELCDTFGLPGQIFTVNRGVIPPEEVAGRKFGKWPG